MSFCWQAYKKFSLGREKVFHRQVVISDTRGGPKIVIRFQFCYKKIVD